jgi:hypothetical protein
MKASPEIQSPSYFTSQAFYITRVSKSCISSKLIVIITNQFKVSSSRQRNLKYDNYTRRQYGHHAKPWHDITRYDQCWPGTGPIPRTNHRTELRAKAQAEESPQGDYLEQKSQCKVEYTNTQQGLPVSWYT